MTNFCENCGKEVKDSEISYYSSAVGDKHLLCPVCYLKHEYKDRKIITIDRYEEKRQKEEYEIYMRRLTGGQSDKSARAGLEHLEEYEEKITKNSIKRRKILNCSFREENTPKKYIPKEDWLPGKKRKSLTTLSSCFDCGKVLKYSETEDWYVPELERIVTVCQECWNKRRED